MPDRVELTGAVVRLEPLEQSHVEGLLEAASEDRSSYSYTLVPADLESMTAYVSSALHDERTGWALPFVVRLASSGRVVGTSRFLDLDYWEGPQKWPPGRPSVGGHGVPTVGEIGGTWLAASVQRTAVNTEKKLLMLEHGFETWKVKRLSLKTDARNSNSWRAIERLGAKFEGIRRAHALALDGTIRDSACFSIVEAEWPDVKRNLHRLLDRRIGGPSFPDS